MEDEDLLHKKVYEEALNECYEQYCGDHSMEFILSIHPMFFNGTYSENNDCTPPDSGRLHSLDEFKKW